MDSNNDQSLIASLGNHVKKLRALEKVSYGNLTVVIRAGPESVLKKIYGPNSVEVREMRTLLEEAKGKQNAPRERDALVGFLEKIQERLKGHRSSPSGPASKIFIGHGRSLVWREVENFLRSDLDLEVEAFETESRTGEQIISILEGFLERCDTALLVLTPDDLTAEGAGRARQNVVHEVGLFQGRLGFNRVALLEQEGIQGFSNIAGLQTIRFREKAREAFHDLREFFEKLGRQ